MKTRSCGKCSGKHWPWQKCQVQKSVELKPAVNETPIEQKPKEQLSRSNVGFPRLGDQFGFQVGVPFSNKKSRFPREGLNEKTF